MSLSALPVGFTFDSKSIDSVKLSDLVDGKHIVLHESTISNNFFLPKKFALDGMTACLYDPSGVSAPTYLSAAYAKSSEGRGLAPSFDEIFVGSNPREVGVEFAAFETQKVLLVANSQSYRYPKPVMPVDAKINSSEERLNLENYYKGFDEILLISAKKSKRDYFSCYDLTKEEVDGALKIMIKK